MGIDMKIIQLDMVLLDNALKLSMKRAIIILKNKGTQRVDAFK